jgi:MEMO1 family protein
MPRGWQITMVFFFMVTFLPLVEYCDRLGITVQQYENASQVMGKDTLINRKPAVAGSFYPANKEELLRNLDMLFEQCVPDNKLKHIVAIIAPHAGYIYSGKVAASAYHQLPTDYEYDHVFIIGSSHHSNFDGASIYSEGNFITPLGIARVDLTLTRKLIANNPDIFVSRTEIQSKEHSLEVQVPFLQYLFKEQLTIVPIVIATQKQSTINKIAIALAPYFGGNNLFIISTDFSHYPKYEDAYLVDKITSDAIMKNNAVVFFNTLKSNEDKGIQNLATSICGWSSMLMLLEITEKLRDIHFHEIQYMNSGDADLGSKDRVVGYNAMVVTASTGSLLNNRQQQFRLSKEEKDELLHIARNSIASYLKNGKVTDIEITRLSSNLQTNAGAFVTLNKDGELRGCIGSFGSGTPLYQVVQEMAVAAATRDYRFSPVSADELPDIEVEISVLSPMHRIQSVDEIQLGKHGIYIKKGSQSGTFLPQVAVQTGWDLEEFLGHCARDKAGIGWDGWKDAEIYVYEAYIFSEH